MNYYGYTSGYGVNPYAVPCGCAATPCCGGTGYGAAIILVLFILLVVVFGAGFTNCNNGGCNKCNNCSNCN